MNIHIIEPLAISAEYVKNLTDYYTAKGHELTYFDQRTIDADELIDRGRGADVVVIANCPFPAKVVDALTEMKLLAVAFTGIDHVAMDSCRARGITVCNASGYSNINVAELTVGFMIDLLRNVTKLDPITRKGGTKDGLVGFDLAGKTVGIVGTGAIGARVAQILKGFDVNLLAYDPYEKEDLKKAGVVYTGIEELMAESDIVTIHCPLMESTRGFIDGDKLSLMKNSAYLVNCARGPIVRTEDLAAILRDGGIAGAALDVFDIEPPLTKETVPFLEMENVIVTPHIAFATAEAFVRRADIVKGNIDAWLEGAPTNVMD